MTLPMPALRHSLITMHFMRYLDELRKKCQELPDEIISRLVWEYEGLTDDARTVLLEEIDARGLVIADPLLTEQDKHKIQAAERNRSRIGCLTFATLYALLCALQFAARRWKAGTYEVDLRSWRFMASCSSWSSTQP